MRLLRRRHRSDRRRPPRFADFKHDFAVKLWYMPFERRPTRHMCKGYEGALLAWEVVEHAAAAAERLAEQPYVEGSDLYLLAQAAWAAYDMALEFERLDRALDEASNGQLRCYLYDDLRELEPSEIERWNRRDTAAKLERWVRSLSDAETRSWWQQRLKERQSLRGEAQRATCAVRQLSFRAAWLESCPRFEELPDEAQEPLRAFRREQIEQATRLTVAMTQAIAEATGQALPAGR